MRTRNRTERFDRLPSIDERTAELIAENETLHRLLAVICSQLTPKQFEQCVAELDGCFKDRAILRGLTSML